MKPSGIYLLELREGENKNMRIETLNFLEQKKNLTSHIEKSKSVLILINKNN